MGSMDVDFVDDDGAVVADHCSNDEKIASSHGVCFSYYGAVYVCRFVGMMVIHSNFWVHPLNYSCCYPIRCHCSDRGDI
jgi:hypothetical protein